MERTRIARSCGHLEGQPDLATLLLRDKNILAARYARQKAGAKFNQIVHDALYRDDVKLSRCVWAIARCGVRQVCTFNFDDLLMEALLTDAADCVIATPDERFQVTHEGITVYHPHGILPRLYRNGELDSAKIVFSEDDYHNLYSDPYSWANIAQLSLLTSRSVLFLVFQCKTRICDDLSTLRGLEVSKISTLPSFEILLLIALLQTLTNTSACANS